MSKIKVLDKVVTNRISAGEVVEKPASIIKELIENSIDAGATRITVEIENGGISRIAITDNGHGMDKDDLTLSIMAHATSKISSVDDLDAIKTLGFRGEALASIAAVSKLEIISKTANQELGHKLISSGGEIEKIEPVACPTGTSVEVNTLFFNTPVRAKFLRKPKTEEADITDYVERMMLAYPHIAFKYIVDDKIIYNTTGGGLLDNIYTIYGKEVAQGVQGVDFEYGDFRITGFVGKPEIAKPNRNYQTLFVGGRYVKNFMISSAIQNAYEHYLMKNKFAFFVLSLHIDPSNVDVNVHPNKLEVKFDKPNQIFTAFYACACDALGKMDQTKNITLVEQETEQAQQNVQLDTLPQNVGASFEKQPSQPQIEQVNLFENVQTDLKNQTVDASSFKFNQNSITNTRPVEVLIETKSIKTTAEQEQKQIEEIKEHQIEKPTPTQQEKNLLFVADYRLVGTLFNTYNIFESGENVYFIDQHAAHERILYDKYMQELATQKIATQNLLVPFVISVKDSEREFLEEYLPLLTSIGFEIELFGTNAFKVLAVPYIFADLSLDKFFADVLSDYASFAKKPMDYIKIVIATKACKAAVKAGHKLTDDEITMLFEKIKQGVLLCPHGRPFVMKLEKTQVEKWFKRVL
jgi:DNA mismatch repair protein MutL